MSPLAITSIGMYTALGHDAVHSCASARAGIRRVLTEDSLPAIKTCPIDSSDISFWSTNRWLDYAVRCLHDLIDYGQLPSAQAELFWQRTALVWALPSLPSWNDEEANENLQRQTGLSLSTNKRWFCFGEHVASAQAILLAQTIFQTEPVDRVIVLAVDSLLDPPIFRSFFDQNRIKGAQNPHGFIPGEAVAAILLEPAATAGKPQAYVQSCCLSDANMCKQDETRKDLAPKLGFVWQQTILKALLPHASQERFTGNLYTDFNGEPWRAAAWGFAVPKLSASIDFERSQVHSYSACFGEIGAAGALCGLALATRAFARGYAGYTKTLVCSLADNGQTAAILLTNPTCAA